MCEHQNNLSELEWGWLGHAQIWRGRKLHKFLLSFSLPSSYRYPSKNAKAELKAGVGTPISAAIAITLRHELYKTILYKKYGICNRRQALTWHLIMAFLKKSSISRFCSAGFLSKASLMLPRKRLMRKDIHKNYLLSNMCKYFHLRMIHPPLHMRAIDP